MIPQIDYRQCPLCQELFRIDDLRIHAKSESEELRKYTIEIIKSQHPELGARGWRMSKVLGILRQTIIAG